MILVGGVALALVFVALGVLLNSAAFTGTEAARDDTADPREALSVRDDVVDGLEGALFYANYFDYRSREALSRTLGNDVSLWDRSLANSSAERRTLAGVNVTRVTNGTQIYQDSVRNFTDGDNENRDWELATGVAGVRRFTVNVSNSSLHDGTNSSKAFHIRFRNSSDTVVHELEFYKPGNETVSLNWDAGSSSGTCDTGEKWAVVDVSAGDVAGANCPAFPAPGDVSGPYSIRYVNPENVNGTYNLVVDGSVDESDFNDQVVQPPPYQVPAIYNAFVEIDHRTATLAYAANVTLAPETTPRGTVFGVALPALPRLSFAYSNGELITAIPGGEPVHHATAVEGVNTVGATRFDFDDDDDGVESPYVDGSSDLRLIDEANDSSLLVSNVLDAGIAVGEFRDSPTSVFYVNGDAKHIYRVRPGGSPVNLSTAAGRSEASSVAGIGDVDGDGEGELAFLGTSQSARYLDDDGTLHAFGSDLGNEYSIGSSASAVGPPADFDGDGVARMPFVDGSGYVSLLDTAGNKVQLSSAAAKERSVASADVDADGDPEVVYLNLDGYLAYVNADDTGGVITDANRDRIGPADTTPGVA